MNPNGQPGQAPQPMQPQANMPQGRMLNAPMPASAPPVNRDPRALGLMSSVAAQSQVKNQPAVQNFQQTGQVPMQQAPMMGGPGYPNQQMPGQQAKTNPNSTQNTLQIAEIRDGIVIMNDGGFRAVVSLHSINFDLMSAQEREAVEMGYQNFLNSLYFDVQIVIRSRKVDMRPYLERLGRIRNEQDNMLLGMLMEDYIFYITQLVEQTNIMSKQFYISIPYYSVHAKQVLGETKSLFGGLMGGGKKQHLVIDEATLNKAKDELQNRVQSVLSGLLQLGVQGAPLDTKELIELYYDVYNPDTATRQPLTSLDNLAGIVVTKGQGEAKQPNLDGGMI